jgi:thiopeptide-type bacteriocin biosynthesis protein
MAIEMDAREDAPLRKDFVSIAGCELPLRDWLAYCLDGDTSMFPESVSRVRLEKARSAFLIGGLGELERHESRDSWVQISLDLDGRPVPQQLYSRLRDVVELLRTASLIAGFFFMHKPPGLRLRVEALPGSRDNIEESLVRHASGWMQEGLIAGTVYGTYEPESVLFGGSTSMDFVHRLFTIDGAFWLEQHARGGSAGSLVSLLMLRSLFQALGINDWEDIDVWERVRSRTGRSLQGNSLPQAAFNDFVEQIQEYWEQPTMLLEILPPADREAIEHANQAAACVAKDWRRLYFDTPHARLGVRAAAALMTIFHWNRAGLSLERQVLFAEALAARRTV